jgi:hypothetical protein
MLLSIGDLRTKQLHRKDSTTGNSLHLYSGGTPTIPTEDFRSFPRSLQWNVAIVLPIYYSSTIPTIYILDSKKCHQIIHGENQIFFFFFLSRIQTTISCVNDWFVGIPSTSGGNCGGASNFERGAASLMKNGKVRKKLERRGLSRFWL